MVISSSSIFYLLGTHVVLYICHYIYYIGLYMCVHLCACILSHTTARCGCHAELALQGPGEMEAVP